MPDHVDRIVHTPPDHANKIILIAITPQHRRISNMSDFLDGNDEIDKHGQKLPHWQQGDSMQFVTFRLGDSMPTAKLSIWKQERDIWQQHHPKPWDEKTTHEYHRRFTNQLEKWLDQGIGSCLFKAPDNRDILEKILMHDQQNQAEQLAWVIMPNHVHLLFKPSAPLPQIMKTWKGISARKIGQGSIWQPNYRDTMIRDTSHMENAIRYIRQNPIHLPPRQYTLWQSPRAVAIM